MFGGATCQQSGAKDPAVGEMNKRPPPAFAVFSLDGFHFHLVDNLNGGGAAELPEQRSLEI